MLIGLTYDLREEYREIGFSEEETAELDSLETIEAIEAVITGLGHEVERIGGIKNLTILLANGRRWDIVFNIAEGMYGLAREVQVPALLDAYEIPYVFSDAMVLALSIHKGMTKHLVRDLGMPTPAFAVISEKTDIELVKLSYPLFVKPVAEGTSKGIGASSKVYDSIQLECVCTELLQRFRQPVLVEEFLPGREFTAGVVGTGNDAKVVGVMEIIIKDTRHDDGYSYRNKIDYVHTVEYKLADEAARTQCSELALKIWRGLGCRDGGRVDMKMDSEGIACFIEVNPLAGLNPVHSDLPILSRMNGLEYDRLVKMIFTSAIERISQRGE